MDGDKMMKEAIKAFFAREDVRNWLWRLSLVNAPKGVDVHVHYPRPFWKLLPLGMWIGFN